MAPHEAPRAARPPSTSDVATWALEIALPSSPIACRTCADPPITSSTYSRPMCGVVIRFNSITFCLFCPARLPVAIWGRLERDGVDRSESIGRSALFGPPDGGASVQEIGRASCLLDQIASAPADYVGLQSPIQCKWRHEFRW